jgi:hypothetical protein
MPELIPVHGAARCATLACLAFGLAAPAAPAAAVAAGEPCAALEPDGRGGSVNSLLHGSVRSREVAAR